MSNQDHSLKNGSYFYITNRSSNSEDNKMALTYTSDETKPQLCFKPLDETSPDQIWMIEEIEHNKFQIVHAYSTLVLSASKDGAWMGKGNWDSSQLFFLQKSDPKGNPLEYWIKTNKLSDVYLQFETRLKCFQSNPKASKCRWQLKPISMRNEIFNSALIQFAYSGLYLDIPGSSLKSGCNIIQFKLNSRCNQRWKLTKIRQTTDYMITSVRSKLCLTVKGGKAKAGTFVVQQPPQNQSPSQMWSLIHQGLSLYIIVSKVKPGLFLGIQKNSMDEMASLVLTKYEQYAFWRIVGPIDKDE